MRNPEHRSVVLHETIQTAGYCMQGPARTIRSNRIANYKNLGPLFKWTDGRAYLIIDKVAFGEKAGAIL